LQGKSPVLGEEGKMTEKRKGKGMTTREKEKDENQKREGQAKIW